MQIKWAFHQLDAAAASDGELLSQPFMKKRLEAGPFHAVARRLQLEDNIPYARRWSHLSQNYKVKAVPIFKKEAVSREK